MQTELISCPLCGVKDYKAVLTDHDRITGIPGFFTLVKCNKCELLYINPRLARECLPYFYSDNYFTYLMAFNQPVSCRPEKHKLLSRIYFYLRDSPVYKYLWKTTLNRLTINNDIDLYDLKLDSNLRVLDVGCSTGLFLEQIRWISGCQIKGVESNDTARNIANKLLGEDTVIPELSGGNYLKKDYFDLVTMWFVFEHLVDPLEVLGKVKRLLKKKGQLVIAVPNAQSWSRFIFKKYWSALDLPRHLMLLTPKTAKQFLTNSNFEIEKIKYGNYPFVYLASIQSIFLKNKCLPGKRIILTSTIVLINLFLFPLGLLEILFHRSAVIIIYARKRAEEAKNLDPIKYENSK